MIKAKTLFRIHRIVGVMNSFQRKLLPVDVFFVFLSIYAIILLISFDRYGSGLAGWIVIYVFFTTDLAYNLQDDGKRWEETDRRFKEMMELESVVGIGNGESTEFSVPDDMKHEATFRFDYWR